MVKRKGGYPLVKKKVQPGRGDTEDERAEEKTCSADALKRRGEVCVGSDGLILISSTFYRGWERHDAQNLDIRATDSEPSKGGPRNNSSPAAPREGTARVGPTGERSQMKWGDQRLDLLENGRGELIILGGGDGEIRKTLREEQWLKTGAALNELEPTRRPLPISRKTRGNPSP